MDKSNGLVARVRNYDYWGLATRWHFTEGGRLSNKGRLSLSALVGGGCLIVGFFFADRLSGLGWAKVTLRAVQWTGMVNLGLSCYELFKSKPSPASIFAEKPQDVGDE